MIKPIALFSSAPATQVKVVEAKKNALPGLWIASTDRGFKDVGSYVADTGKDYVLLRHMAKDVERRVRLDGYDDVAKAAFANIYRVIELAQERTKSFMRDFLVEPNGRMKP